MRYWIGVVSKEHVQRGVRLGIAQIGHGKRGGLARMQAGDGFIYYSPKNSLDSVEPLQAFTAIGHIADSEIWQADEGVFQPWRRRVTYAAGDNTAIRPLLDKLSLTAGRQNWGSVFRYGLVEITAADFDCIAKAMKAVL